MAKHYQSRSRLLRKIEKQSRKNLILAFLGIIFVVLVVFKVGIPLLVQFSLLIGNLSSSTPETKNEGPNFLQTPSLDPLPTATNSATIKITGLALPKKDVEVFVGDTLANKVTAGEDGKFEIPSLKLQEGQNSIRVRVRDEDRKSDFSENLNINFDDKPPPLEITNPTSGQTFTKDQSKIEVKGKTDPEAKVTVNDFRAIVDSEGGFSYTLVLSNGENRIQIKSRDLAGNEIQNERTVTFSP